MHDMEAFAEYMHSYMRSSDETVSVYDTRDYCVLEKDGQTLYVIPVSAHDWVIYATDESGRVVPIPNDDIRIPPDDWERYKKVLDWCFYNRDADFVVEFLRVPYREVIYHTVKHLAIAAPELLVRYAAALIHDLTSPHSVHHNCLYTQYFLKLLYHVPISDPEVFHAMVVSALVIPDGPYRGYILFGLARQKDRYIEQAFEYLRTRSESERAAVARLYGYILELSELPNYHEYRRIIGHPNVPPASVLVSKMFSRVL